MTSGSGSWGSGAFGFDPLRPFETMASLWSSTVGKSPLVSGPAMILRTVFDTARRRLVGRTITVDVREVEITMTVLDIDADLDVLGLPVGQLDDVRLRAADISWADHRFAEAEAVARNVHLRAGTVPVLVASPVVLELTLTAERAVELVEQAAPWLIAAIEEAATEPAAVVGLLRWRRYPNLGHVEVVPALDGTTLWLRPRTVVVRGRRWAVPPRVPSVPIRLPAPPGELRLTGVTLEPDALVVRGELPEWRMPVPAGRIDDLLRQLNSMSGLLDLRKWTR